MSDKFLYSALGVSGLVCALFMYVPMTADIAGMVMQVTMLVIGLLLVAWAFTPSGGGGGGVIINIG